MKISNWLKSHSDVTYFLTSICDLNGVMRGKRVPRAQASKIFDGSLRMPMSNTFLDIWGEEIANSPMILESGDSDGVSDWTGREPLIMNWLDRPAALVPLWMKTESGEAYLGDPRQMLANILTRYAAKGYRPVVATELEFYLYDRSNPTPKPPKMPITGKSLSSDSVYNLSELQQFDSFLNDVYDACEQANIPADAAIAENGPGQFEINLLHCDDALKAADDAILFKEIVRGTALKHGLGATFMAKPYGERAGNGMHVHFSLLDENDNNIFDNGGDDGADIMKHAVAGLLQAMPDQTLIFAPHANSYRRLRLGSYAPTFAAWGYENRTTAIRIPGGSSKARRIEHRVAGGDSNPYLVLAAILSSALEGIENKLTPAAPIAGEAYLKDLPPLAANWQDAITKFESSELIARQLSPLLQGQLVECKRQEIEVFSQKVTDFEYESYLESL